MLHSRGHLRSLTSIPRLRVGYEMVDSQRGSPQIANVIRRVVFLLLLQCL